MYTDPPGIAAQIIRSVVSRFSTEVGIDPEHLLDRPDDLTPVEVMRAHRAGVIQ